MRYFLSAFTLVWGTVSKAVFNLPNSRDQELMLDNLVEILMQRPFLEAEDCSPDPEEGTITVSK
jgi:hypothetical protein